jgi:hypothetical protein
MNTQPTEQDSQRSAAPERREAVRCTAGLGDIDRGKLLRHGYEAAVAWYKDEGTTEAHEAVLAWWNKWAAYARAEREKAMSPNAELSDSRPI